MIMTFSTIYGQRHNRTTAFNYLRNGKLDKAKEFIDKTIKHPKTIDDARTWFYRGNIYLSIHLSDNPEYKALSDSALEISFESYLKAKDYDDRNNYFTDIISNIFVISEQFYNKGVLSYNEGHFKNAMFAFQQSIEASEILGAIDTMAVFNVAITAEVAEENDVAKKHYSDLIEMEFENPEIYTAMGRIHIAEGDTALALEYLASGRELFPEDFNLLINTINIYLLLNDVENAIKLLELAIEKDNTNPTIFFAAGVAYDQLRNKLPEQSDKYFVKTKNAYIRALELDPDYFDATYNLGALYVNTAAMIIDEANELPLEKEKEFNQMIAEANEFLGKSLPRLEKALELQPGDFSTMVSLKEIYTRLNKFDKLQDINNRIKEYQENN